ncbi:LytR/AlgR family response regulator transcription factor [Flavilitoribacter nigricans]|uniref:DNA-binding response regulator n=1 Tax=Flavilitoribacter nigricans (strain ATCC 23147 / DSM 23189 / NBRC 102662 / NCIMB 1420 / SS-2) TaxID=1122177 RepID=A0A2D0NAB3_FLAN2|nr:LytTR family DNA-binding domain-containing protein [Flavilitoribacter nigricans]PHN05425.1 DNA-binding response regulator [Flavilitoribacter nigricans DSM 23189 = NBRC 102662]
MIKAVIIDDEQHSIDTLEWKLQHYCSDVSIEAAFTDAVEGVEFLQNNPVDLLFLDIEMPKLSGFDVLEEIGPSISFDIIFVTAYDSFGIRAIKFSALDYLLKPVQNKELVAAVNKHQHRDVRLSSMQMDQLFQNVRAERNGRPGKVGLISRDSIEYVDPEQIILCEASSNYTLIHLMGEPTRLISKTLKEFETMLQTFGFFRAHNSYVINLAHVKEYVRSDGGYLIMKNKVKVPVSKSKKEELLMLLSN